MLGDALAVVASRNQIKTQPRKRRVTIFYSANPVLRRNEYIVVDFHLQMVDICIPLIAGWPSARLTRHPTLRPARAASVSHFRPMEIIGEHRRRMKLRTPGTG